jgi:Leucine rich repeat
MPNFEPITIKKFSEAYEQLKGEVLDLDDKNAPLDTKQIEAIVAKCLEENGQQAWAYRVQERLKEERQANKVDLKTLSTAEKEEGNKVVAPLKRSFAKAFSCNVPLCGQGTMRIASLKWIQTEIQVAGKHATLRPSEVEDLRRKMISELRQWIASGPADEKRAEAARRILQCWERHELWLDLSYLGLRILPDIFGELSWLQKLDVSRNQLESLPAIGELSWLQKLDVSRNQLKSLPDSIGKFLELQELYIHNNQLESVPAISLLSKLRRLHAYANQLLSLPPSIGSLSSLEQLNVSANHISSLPKSILLLPRDCEFTILSQDILGDDA